MRTVRPPYGGLTSLPPLHAHRPSPSQCSAAPGENVAGRSAMAAHCWLRFTKSAPPIKAPGIRRTMSVITFSTTQRAAGMTAQAHTARQGSRLQPPIHSTVAGRRAAWPAPRERTLRVPFTQNAWAPQAPDHTRHQSHFASRATWASTGTNTFVADAPAVRIRRRRRTCARGRRIAICLSLRQVQNTSPQQPP